MKQTNVNIKRKLAVCPEAAGMSQMRINKECFFWPKLAQKWVLESEFRKYNSEFGISSSKILCVLVFGQNEQL